MEVVPDSQERSCLMLAGLGEKKIQLDDLCEWDEIYEELLFQYPKLKDGGGFELLRVSEGGGKRLQVIACRGTLSHTYVQWCTTQSCISAPYSVTSVWTLIHPKQ